MEPNPCDKDTIGPDADDPGDSVAGPLLDHSEQNCTKYLCRECDKGRKRKGRAFQRSISGLRIWGQEWQLWTLTLSDDAVTAGVDISRAWKNMHTQMTRLGLLKGYFRVIEYTRRGRAHLHVLVAGPPIPHWWMMEEWWYHTRSYVVWFTKVRTWRGGAGYVAKYLAKDPRARYSSSWTWVWRGFTWDWKALVREGLDAGHSFIDIIAMWECILDSFREHRARDAPEGTGV